MNRRKFLVRSGGVLLAACGASGLERVRMGSMNDYNRSVAISRARLADDPGLKEIIRYAALAASGHNTQPWKFRISKDGITILPDLTRTTPVVDPDNHHLYISLGCAAENLILSAGARGHPGELRYFPEDTGAVEFRFKPARSQASPLFQAIPHRQSTRSEYDGRKVSSNDLRALKAAALIPGVDLLLITDEPQMARMRDLVIASNTAQMNDPAFVKELKTWLRFNPRQAIRTGDGLFSGASGSPSSPSWLGPYAFDWFFSADAENEKYARQMRSSSGIAVFISQHPHRDHWVRTGRACQRFALQATALGLKHAFINQPVEAIEMRKELATLIGMPERRPDLIMRFGYGETLPFSARRPIEATLA